MSTNVQTVAPAVSADEAYDMLWRARIHHLVVMDRAKVVGVVSDRDLGGARGQRLRAGCTVSDLMSGKVVTAAPTTTLRQAANLMRGRSLGCLPVMQRGRLRGLVTVSDLLEHIGREGERPVVNDRAARR